MPERIIRITPYGRMANQMLQFMMAERLRLSIKDARIAGYSLPKWNLVSGALPKENALSLSIRSNVVPLEQIVDFANSIDHLDIRIVSTNLRYAYYRPMLDHYRTLFQCPPSGNVAPGADDLVIAIRLGDILKGWHRNYMPLPISWYADLVKQTGLNPIFVGEIGTDFYSEALRRRFPKARFIAHEDPMIDFDTLRRSVNIVPSIGTFSWLASWLSETAQAIYFPVAGLFNQLGRPDVDLLPLDDKRYRFFESAMQEWSATPAQIDHIVNRAHDFREISPRDLKKLFAPHIGTYGQGLQTRSMEL